MRSSVYKIYVRGMAMSGAPFEFHTTALAFVVAYVLPCGVLFSEVEVRQELGILL